MVNIYLKTTSCWAENHPYKRKSATKAIKPQKKKIFMTAVLHSLARRGLIWRHLRNHLAGANTHLLKPQGGIIHAAPRSCLSHHSVLGFPPPCNRKSTLACILFHFQKIILANFCAEFFFFFFVTKMSGIRPVNYMLNSVLLGWNISLLESLCGSQTYFLNIPAVQVNP